MAPRVFGLRNAAILYGCLTDAVRFSAVPFGAVAPPPQTGVQASWLSESPRPRPRAPGKLLSSTSGGYALALLRLEALKAAEAGEMKLFVTGADNQPINILPRRPAWWPSETKEEEWTE